MRARTDRNVHWLLLLLLFVGSGGAALIYEVVWFQLLQLVIGLTNASMGLLLGVFMGGMCLGSLLLPRWIAPRHHPLKVYAWIEIGIALFGVAILFVVPRVSAFYTAHGGSGLAGVLVRGGVVALCLLPPTVLMGATLPAVARWIETTREGVAWLGFFYGGNIAGAVGGCLLAGFFLLRVHDMATATYVAAALNVGVAVVALVLAACVRDQAEIGAASGVVREAEPAVAVGAPNEGGESPQGGQTDAAVWPVYVAVALSGLTALAAEVAWTRLLSLLLGGTVYTFSIILAVFLAGLGLGSGAGSFLAKSCRDPRLALVACQWLLMAAVAWSAVMISRSLPFWPVEPSLARSPWFTFQLDMARCLWALLPPSILWGASFPLALAAVAPGARDSGKLVGGLYAANTVGAILGALGFSLVVIPFVGTQSAQQMLIGLCGVAGLFAFGRRAWVAHGSGAGQGGAARVCGRLLVRTLPVVLLAALFAGVVAPLPWGVVAYGRFMVTYRDRLAPGLAAEAEIPAGGTKPDIYCTYVGEGLNGTIAVTRWTSGVRNFHSAGKVQASTDPRDMRLQRMLGHLSALAHTNAESILVVACGAGVTAGSFVPHPETKRIVICDIEPLVPRVVAPMFTIENFGVVQDPRTQVVSDDGRHFIRTTQERFDVITSDPIDPWVKGCAALNTVEYYEMCKARLKPGGVMSLWIPLYETNVETVRSVVATFFKVFPNGVLWSNDEDGEGYDAVLLGQVEPSRFDLDRVQERLDRGDHAWVRSSLAEAGFHSAVDLFATYAGRAVELEPWLRGAQINTDNDLRLQYLAGWSFNSYVGGEILGGIVKHRSFPTDLFVGSEEVIRRLKARF
jgi:spermidine synthase